MPARTCNITAEMNLDDFNVQVLDYRWDVHETISECEESFILRYRPYPAKVSVAAQLKSGHLQEFGSLMFFPAEIGVETTPATVSERARNVVCSFTDSWIRRIWPDRQTFDASDLARCYDLRNFRIEQAMQRLGSELENPGFATSVMVDSLAQFIVVEIARHFGTGASPKRLRTSEGQFSPRELSRIYEYVDSAVNRCPTTEEISQQCGISAAHLRRSFRKSTGQTLHRYVADARLKKSQTILAETDLPLKEVAYRLGFKSASTFSSTFRKEAGETPSGYRHRVREFA